MGEIKYTPPRSPLIKIAPDMAGLSGVLLLWALVLGLAFPPAEYAVACGLMVMMFAVGVVGLCVAAAAPLLQSFVDADCARTGDQQVSVDSEIDGVCQLLQYRFALCHFSYCRGCEEKGGFGYAFSRYARRPLCYRCSFTEYMAHVKEQMERDVPVLIEDDGEDIPGYEVRVMEAAC